MRNAIVEVKRDLTYRKASTKDTTEATFGYTRYVNNLPAVFDTMSVRVDSRGEVLGFNYNYHEIEFPAANLVSEEEAYRKLFEHMKPNLYYTGFNDLQLKAYFRQRQRRVRSEREAFTRKVSEAFLRLHCLREGKRCL